MSDYPKPIATRDRLPPLTKYSQCYGRHSDSVLCFYIQRDSSGEIEAGWWSIGFYCEFTRSDGEVFKFWRDMTSVGEDWDPAEMVSHWLPLPPEPERLPGDEPIKYFSPHGFPAQGELLETMQKIAGEAEAESSR